MDAVVTPNYDPLPIFGFAAEYICCRLSAARAAATIETGLAESVVIQIVLANCRDQLFLDSGLTLVK